MVQLAQLYIVAALGVLKADLSAVQYSHQASSTGGVYNMTMSYSPEPGLRYGNHGLKKTWTQAVFCLLNQGLPCPLWNKPVC